jgi:3-(3-hydroxy-phenyl)propionate hydroxylase
MAPQLDALIIGAGPVGLALAADLARWGVSFRIVDAKPGPEQHSKAASFWPRTQEVAAAMGFGQQVINTAVHIKGQTVVAFGKVIGHPPSGPHPSPYPNVLSVNQGSVERTMRDHLIGIGHPVEYGTAAGAITQDSHGATATLTHADHHQETVHARYLIACDGSRSAARESVGLSIAPIPLPNRALRQVDARLHWSRPLTHDHIWFFLFDDGFCGVLPLPDGYYRIFLCEDDRHMPDRPPTLLEMQEALRRITGDTQVELADPIWMTHGAFRYGVASQFRAGRVFLAGDAGHMTIPIGGQGMNAGIQDAFNLGWKLAAVLQGRAPEALLDTYSSERQTVRQELAEDQATNFQRLMKPSAWQKWTTYHLGPVIMRRNRSVELGRRDEAQLTINYPTSPMTSDILGKGGVRAGDRAPDSPVVRMPDCQTITLFSLIYQRNWTLLTFLGDTDARSQGGLDIALNELGATYPDIQVWFVSASSNGPHLAKPDTIYLSDRDRLAFDAYQIRQSALLLIRPDGHIGFRGGLVHIKSLSNYCARWMTPSHEWSHSNGR